MIPKKISIIGNAPSDYQQHFLIGVAVNLAGVNHLRETIWVTDIESKAGRAKIGDECS